MCNLRYDDCHSGQDTQMLHVLVKLDKVTSLLSNPRQITLDYIVFAMNSIRFYYSLSLQFTYM